MNRSLSRSFSAVALCATVAASASVAPIPARADGAASTRNIIFGAAAVGAGTLIILNHNKKVHEKYAEYDQRQAATQAEANQSQAAYESERQAYEHEAALVSEYKKETAYQHTVIERGNKQVASLQSQLRSRGSSGLAGTNFVRTVPASAASAGDPKPAGSQMVSVVSFGWGTY